MRLLVSCLVIVCVAWCPSFCKRIINPLTASDLYRGRTAPLTSKHFISYIYSTNIGTEYFKHGLYSPFFPLQNAVCFIILMYLVPLLFTFYIQDVLKLKNNCGAKRLTAGIDTFFKRLRICSPCNYLHALYQFHCYLILLAVSRHVGRNLKNISHFGESLKRKLNCAINRNCCS
jgi:hypothetical protein